MKSKRLLLMLLIALIAPWAANAQSTLTVCDGGNTNSNVPIYSLYADYGTRSQFIIPAALLDDMAGGTIQNIKFYNNTASINFDQGFTVYMLEVDYTTFASTTLVDWSSMTEVYQGTLTVSDNEMSIELQNPFTYRGENLMIGIQVTTWGTICPSSNWQGENQTGRTGLYNNANSSHAWSTTVTGVNFIPKTTFTYTPGAAPSCPKPTNLTVSNVTSSNASFSWTKGGDETEWVLEYSTASNFTNAVSVPRSGIPAIAIDDFAPATTYYARVKAVCGGGDESNWSNVVTFTTACASYDIPYTYGFEEAAPFDCWTVISGNVTVKNSTYNSHASSYYLDFRGTTSNMVALPQFNETTNNLRVEFWTRPESTGGNSGKFAVGYMTDITDASTFVAVSTYNSTEMTTTYVKKTVDFVDAPAGANIAMRQFDCTTNYYWYVDDVTVKEIPSCVAPTALAAVASTTSAELSWTANSGETAWTIYYKKTTDENYTDVPNATNPYTLRGLDAATNYEFYVVANCSANDASEPSEVFTFATECDVIPALGFSENFDSYTAGNNVLPNCWSYINTTTNSTYAVYPRVYANGSYSTYANSAPNCLYFYSYGSSDPQPQYAILPEMTGLAGLQVTLMAKGYNATSTFKIGTMSDPTDASTFTMIAEQTLTTSYPTDPFEYLIPADCRDNYLAIMMDAAPSGYNTRGVYIDNIVIREAPTCFKPTGLAVTEGSVINDGATITWTPNGSETQWQIEFATDADFTHPLYETVEGEPTYTFHGLDETTTYYVHVQAVCGGSNGSSEYSATVNFTTLQTPANLPYVTDFESENGWLFVNGTLTNAWAYGEATNNGGTHALYISNDGGTTNAYTNSSATMVYATKLFTFEDGTYVFSYDWKANGESTYDYLRVALVPSTVTLTPGTTPSVPSGSFYNNLPTGWIALDGGGKLNLSSDWQSFASNEMEIAAGTYMMVFAWKDDTSGGSNPPAAIDNVSIVKITCLTPTGLTADASGITATSAQLSWTENGEATAWQIELTDEEENVITIDVDETDLVNGVYTIASLTSETMYAAKVRANCGDGYSQWSEEEIFETAADCQMSDGLAAAATSNSAEISWNGYGQETFNLRYSPNSDTWITELGVTNPYTLTSLTPATTYYVQVQPICASEDTWSEEYSFHTECASITTFPWNEGFEDGVLSYCWDQDGNGTWSVGTGDGNTYSPVGAHTGSYNAMITHNTSGNVTKLITPVLDLTSLNHPALTFWFINRKWSNDIDGFAVYYRTASNAEWTQIEATEEAHETWTKAFYVLPEPSATYQIAFEMTDDYGYGVGIDDVVVEEAPTFTKHIAAHTATGGWYLIASPLAEDVTPTVDNGFLANEFDLYQFNQAADKEWENWKAEGDHYHFNITNGRGYLYANSGDVDLTFIGEPYSGNGEIRLSKSEGVEFPGMNLVGNPFPTTAYIDRDYYTMNDGATALELVDFDGIKSIEYMEGIFVEAESDGEILTFTTDETTVGNNKGLILNLSQGRGIVDRAIVRFGEGHKLHKFMLQDGTKMYIPQGGEDFAVVRSRNSGEVTVNFEPAEDGIYSISVDARNLIVRSLILTDKVERVNIDLLRTPTYQFKASTTDPADRFVLSFKTGLNQFKELFMAGEKSADFGFFNNGNLMIDNEGEATLQVIDVNGRVLSSETINGNASIKVDAAPGVYMLRLINGDNVKVQKVVVE